MIKAGPAAVELHHKFIVIERTQYQPLGQR